MSSKETKEPAEETEAVADEATTAAPASDVSSDVVIEEYIDEEPSEHMAEETESAAAEQPETVPEPAVEAEPGRFPWKPIVIIVLLMGLCGLAFFYLSWSGVLGVSSGPVSDPNSVPTNDLTPVSTGAADPATAQSAYSSMILTVSMMVAGLVFLAAINTALIIVIVVFLRKMVQAIARLNDSLNGKNDPK